MPSVDSFERRDLMSVIHPGIVHVQDKAPAKPKAPKPPKPSSGYPLQIMGTIYITEQLEGSEIDGVYTSKYVPVRIGHVEFDYVGKDGKALVYRLKPDVNFTASLTDNAVISHIIDRVNGVWDLFDPGQGFGESGTFTVAGTLKITPSRKHVVGRKVVFNAGTWDLDAGVTMSYTYQHFDAKGEDTMKQGYEDIPIRGSGTTIEYVRGTKKPVTVYILPPTYMFYDTGGDNPNTEYIAQINLHGGPG